MMYIYVGVYFTDLIVIKGLKFQATNKKIIKY